MAGGEKNTTTGYCGYIECYNDYEDKPKSSAKAITQAPTNEKTRVAWEDKTTGSYYRENKGVKITDDEYRRYTNITVGNKSEGYSAKYYAEEKYQKPSQPSQGKGKSSKYVKHYK